MTRYVVATPGGPVSVNADEATLKNGALEFWQDDVMVAAFAVWAHFTVLDSQTTKAVNDMDRVAPPRVSLWPSRPLSPLAFTGDIPIVPDPEQRDY